MSIYVQMSISTLKKVYQYFSPEEQWSLLDIDKEWENEIRNHWKLEITRSKNNLGKITEDFETNKENIILQNDLEETNFNLREISNEMLYILIKKRRTPGFYPATTKNLDMTSNHVLCWSNNLKYAHDLLTLEVDVSINGAAVDLERFAEANKTLRALWIQNTSVNYRVVHLILNAATQLEILKLQNLKDYFNPVVCGECTFLRYLNIEVETIESTTLDMFIDRISKLETLEVIILPVAKQMTDEHAITLMLKVKLLKILILPSNSKIGGVCITEFINERKTIEKRNKLLKEIRGPAYKLKKLELTINSYYVTDLTKLILPLRINTTIEEMNKLGIRTTIKAISKQESGRAKTYSLLPACCQASTTK